MVYESNVRSFQILQSPEKTPTKSASTNDLRGFACRPTTSCKTKTGFWNYQNIGLWANWETGPRGSSRLGLEIDGQQMGLQGI